MEKDYKKYVTDETIGFVCDMLTEVSDLSIKEITDYYVLDKNFRTMRLKKWLVIANSGLPFNRDLWYKDYDAITADDKVQIAKTAMAMKINSVPMWFVSRDNEGGCFGMGHLYTREGWAKWLCEWAVEDFDKIKERSDYYQTLSDEDFFDEASSICNVTFEKWENTDEQRKIINDNRD